MNFELYLDLCGLPNHNRQYLCVVGALASITYLAHIDWMNRSQLKRNNALLGEAEWDSQRQICEWPGCELDGEFRAPTSRSALRQFRRFCLEHVRCYNRSWNFFAGLSEAQIEEIRRRDTVWDRPTWPMGTGPSIQRMEDPLFLLGKRVEVRAHTPRDAALAELGLDRLASFEKIKSRYKLLAKKHHPDANGGSKNSEKRFVAIQEAYDFLVRDAHS